MVDNERYVRKTGDKPPEYIILEGQKNPNILARFYSKKVDGNYVLVRSLGKRGFETEIGLELTIEQADMRLQTEANELAKAGNSLKRRSR